MNTYTRVMGCMLALFLPLISWAGEDVVYKSPSCGCCHLWEAHMQNNGFTFRSEKRDDMQAVKQHYGISSSLASCHTAIIGGYLIEGHVPASDVQRLLNEQPKGVRGLTAPGMPMKSPGMQAEGLPPRGYDVLAFDAQGKTSVYHHYD